MTDKGCVKIGKYLNIESTLREKSINIHPSFPSVNMIIFKNV